MRRKRNRILSYLILLTFVLTNAIGSLGIANVYAEENELITDSKNPVTIESDNGQAIRGIPGFISKPATKDDINYLNNTIKKSSITPKILPSLSSTKTFTVYNAASKAYDNIDFTLERIGEHSYVYLEEGNSDFDDQMLDSIVSQFESIYAKNVSVFGTPPDIDNDKRINILLLDIQDPYTYSYIAGFFDSVNQLPKIFNPESNECEVFFMDINEGFPDPGTAAETNFYGTLAHEFQHMIQYGTYLKNYTSTNDTEDTWLNEALSCLSEYLNLDEHPLGQIEEFLADNFAAGYGLIDWDNDGSLANYGASYMFALYMYDEFGLSFIKDLAADPETGIQSIEDQLMAYKEGMDFDELFERFQVATIVGEGYDFDFSEITTSNIRQLSYDSLGYNPNMRFYSFSAYDGSSQFDISTLGAYRGFAVFFDGNLQSDKALKLNFTSDSGTYYIVKPFEPYSYISDYRDFSQSDKVVEEIKPDLVDGNILELGDDQWAMLIYMAKDTPITNNKLTVTEIAAPVHTETEKPSTPKSLTYKAGYNSVTLEWEPSSYYDSVEGYYIYRDGIQLKNYPVSTTSFTDLTVEAGTTYNYQVEAAGWDNKKSDKSASVEVTTASTPDINAPGAPVISYLSTYTDAGEAYISIRLTAPSNLSDLDHYEVISLLNGMEDGYYSPLTAAGTLNLSSFNPGSTYTLYAYAVDTSGNYSPSSNKLYVKAGTGQVAIATQPTVPTNISASGITENGLTLRWTASTQAQGILEYNVYRDGAFIGKTAGNTAQYSDSSLTANTTYTYTIEAVGRDADNLNSEYSAPYTVKTLAIPPVLTADTTDISIDNNLAISFTDNVNWRNAVSSIKVDGVSLSEASYSKSPGYITINSGAITTAGSHTITVIAAGYSNAQVTQNTVAGAASAAKSTATINQALSLGSTRTVTLTAKDQGGNAVAGHQFYMDIKIFSNSSAANESYTVAGAVYSAAAPTTVTGAVYSNVIAGSITGLDGKSTVQVIMPGAMDYNDGISIQFKLAADGSNVGSPIGYIRTAPSEDNNNGSSSGKGGGGGGGGGSSTTSPAYVPASVPGETIITAGTIENQMGSTTTNIITVNVNGTNNMQTVAIRQEALSLLDSKKKLMSINTNGVNMTFSSGILGSGLRNMDKDSSLVIGINKLNSNAVNETLTSTSNDNKNGLFRIGNYVFQFEAKLTGKNGSTNLTSFNSDISITISLKDIDLSSVDTDKLGAYYFNEKSNTWEYVGGKYDPVTRSITFTTNHFSYYTVMRYEKSFSDIKGHWAQKDIEKLAARHVFRNIAEEQFKPDAKVTRSEFIAMLVRALELKSINVKPIAFKDITQDKYYYGEVMTAWELGITAGDDTGKFRPGDNITREQLAAMIARTLDYLKKSPNLTESQISQKLSAYTDTNDVSDFAKIPMAIALEKKIINGWKSDLLAPKENATRAEAAVMLQRLINGL